MTDSKRNIINSRHIYFTSLFADTPEDDDNPRQTQFFEKYDEYLEVQLQKHVIDRMKHAAMESKSYSVNPKQKFGKDIQNLVQKNCFLYEALDKENKQFLQYLHDKDEWEKKVADYTTRYKKIISEEAENVEQPSIESAAQVNSSFAEREYSRRFPQQTVPQRFAIKCGYRHLGKTGSFIAVRTGRPVVRDSERILAEFDQEPSLSTHCAIARLQLHKLTIQRELQRITRSKLKAEQGINKKRNKALMLEELSKCLLVWASNENNVDFLQDESIREIFFTDKC